MIPTNVIYDRLLRGWSDHEAATRPLKCPKWRWEAEQRLGYSVTRAIAEMRAEGHTQASIGAQLGCSAKTIRKTANG